MQVLLYSLNFEKKCPSQHGTTPVAEAHSVSRFFTRVAASPARRPGRPSGQVVENRGRPAAAAAPPDLSKPITGNLERWQKDPWSPENDDWAQRGASQKIPAARQMAAPGPMPQAQQLPPAASIPQVPPYTGQSFTMPQAQQPPAAPMPAPPNTRPHRPA